MKGGIRLFPMKGMLATFSTANTEAIQALVDSNSATVAAVAAGMGSTLGTQPKRTIGSVTTVTPTKTPAELMLAAEVAALKLPFHLLGSCLVTDWSAFALSICLVVCLPLT